MVKIRHNNMQKQAHLKPIIRPKFKSSSNHVGKKINIERQNRPSFHSYYFHNRRFKSF